MEKLKALGRSLKSQLIEAKQQLSLEKLQHAKALHAREEECSNLKQEVTKHLQEKEKLIASNRQFVNANQRLKRTIDEKEEWRNKLRKLCDEF